MRFEHVDPLARAFGVGDAVQRVAVGLDILRNTAQPLQPSRHFFAPGAFGGPDFFSSSAFAWLSSSYGEFATRSARLIVATCSRDTRSLSAVAARGSMSVIFTLSVAPTIFMRSSISARFAS